MIVNLYYTYWTKILDVRNDSRYFFETFEECKKEAFSGWNGVVIIIRSEEKFIKSSSPHASYMISLKNDDHECKYFIFIRGIKLKRVGNK